MSTRFWAKPMTLAVLLIAQASQAQKVVVLDFKGDSRGRIRSQLEKALRAEGLSVVALRKYKQEVDRRGVKGGRAGNPTAAAAMSSAMGLSGLVKGQVKGELGVTVLDASGSEVLNQTAQLSRGSLAGESARSLAAQIVDVLRPRAAPAKPPPPPPPPRAEAPPESKPDALGQTLPELDLSQEAPKKAEKKPREEAESRVAAEAGEVEKPERPEPGRVRIGPKLITAQLLGSGVWRSYCSRPGVSSCKDYDAQSAAQRAPGDTVDFNPQSPYPGLALGIDLFPFANMNPWLAGLGIEASYGRGFSTTNVTQGATTRQISGSDNAFSGVLAYRYYFPLSVAAGPLPGYAGIHFGYALRSFSVDSSASPLLGSKRSYPMLGLEFSLPIISFLRVEGSGNLFLGPKAGQDQLSDYGTSVSSSGLGFEAGFAGDVWGPLGYVARFKYSSYSDTFSGRGTSWQNGGAAQETYTGIYAGVTVSY